MYKTCIIKVFSDTSNEKVYEFSKFLISIGSLNSDDIKLESSSCVLPNHITIRQENDKFFFLNNCYSGVNINNKITSEVELKDGDEIQFGSAGPKLLFKTNLTDNTLPNSVAFTELKSPEEKIPDVKQIELSKKVKLEKDLQLLNKDPISLDSNNEVNDFKEIHKETTLIHALEPKGQDQIINDIVNPETEQKKENTSEKVVESKNDLTIKKDVTRKTTFGEDIDALKADIAPHSIEEKLDHYILKTFKPKHTTKIEKYNEMVSIIKEHNKSNEDYSLKNTNFKPKKRKNIAKTVQTKSDRPPPYATYIFVAGIISAIFFIVGLSVTNNGLSFFTLAPIAVALIAVDLINNSYAIPESRLTNSIFMAMGIVILQTILVAIFSVLGSFDQLGQYDIISYFINQIMFLSHQLVMCIILLFLVTIFTFIYMQKKFPDNL